MVESMEKIAADSHFELIPASELEKYGNKIVQICPKQAYNNGDGYAVYLCEVLNKEA